MGIFSKKEICCICGERDGKNKIADGYVCKGCILRYDPFRKMSNEDFEKIYRNSFISKFEKIKISKEKNRELLDKFTLTNKVKNYIEFDENNKLWLLPDNKIEPTVFAYDDIIEYELLEDGETLTKGGVGRAVAGGVLFGGVGAVVGGITGKKTKTVINNMSIKITINSTKVPLVYIPILLAPTEINSMIYKIAKQESQQILSILARITSVRKMDDVNQNLESISVADELKKLKNLVDEGILTEEEFTSEKNKILNR